MNEKNKLNYRKPQGNTEECTASEDAVSYVNSEDAGTLKAAIEALEKQEQDRWRPFKCREATEDDDTSYDYIMECELPEDGQTVLVTIQIKGHESVQVDTYYGGGGEECALDSGYALCEEAIAWRPLPEPYTEEEA